MLTDALKQLVERYGSQTELAKALGTTQPRVNKWLHGATISETYQRKIMVLLDNRAQEIARLSERLNNWQATPEEKQQWLCLEMSFLWQNTQGADWLEGVYNDLVSTL